MSVVFYGCMTLDGFLADKNHDLSWLYETETGDNWDYDSFYNTVDIVVMGRNTYDAVKDMTPFPYSGKLTYVFSNTIESTDNVEVVNCDPVAFVDSFENKTIWIVGGGSLLGKLIEADKVDEMFVQIAPVLLGEGIPLFGYNQSSKRFKLESVKSFGEFTEIHYKK